MLLFVWIKPFLVILTSAGFVNVLLALFFVPLYRQPGMAVAVTLTELLCDSQYVLGIFKRKVCCL